MNAGKKLQTVMWYSVFFAVLVIAVFLPFYAEGRSLLWDPDAVVYHIPMAEVFAETVKKIFTEGHFIGYDLSIGMGTDVLLYISQWYMEPINLLYACFGPEAAETLYGILIFVRLYLAGISFLIFSREMKEPCMARVTGALVYVFSGYTLFTGTKAAPFLVAMILLPLIFYAEEKIRGGKSRILFVILIAFSAIFSYYFLFMNSVLLAVYVLIALFTERTKIGCAVKYIAKLMGCYLTGLAMAGAVFFPSVTGFLGSSRSGGARNVDSFLHYDATYYKNLVVGFFKSQPLHDYWGVIGFSPLVLAALLLVFWQKDKTAVRIKAAWIVLLGGVCVPLFGCLMNGGKVANNRWLYALIFVGGLTVCKAYTEIGRIAARFFTKKAVRCVMLVWCVCLIVSLGIGGYRFFAESGEGFVKEFHKSGKAYNIMTNNSNIECAEIEDDSLYRVDNARTAKTASSAWVVKEYRGLVTNASGYAQEMADYYRYFENAGVITSFRLGGMDNSTILTTLAGVKYYTADEGKEKRIPYGYEYLQGNLYENKYAVPFSYSYNSFVLQSEVQEMTPVQKQEIVLQSAIVDEEAAEELAQAGIEKKDTENLELASAELAYEIVNEDGVVISESGTNIRTKKENAGFDMVIGDIPGAGEVYIEWKGIAVLPEEVTAATITIREDDVVVSSISFQQKEATYSSGNDTYAANIGYADAEERKVHISFTKEANYAVEEIKVYYLPMDRYEENLYELTQDTLEITEWSDTEIVGTVSTKEKKILCLPLINNGGWRVFADGEEQKLYKLNLMYSGLVVSEEMKEICFVYETPFLKAGLWISLLGILVFAGMILYEKKGE